MQALIQRVSEASVTIGGCGYSRIGPGLLVLLGVEKDDDEEGARRLCQRIISYRVFSDSAGRMNRDVQEVNGELLIVPQFTLAADTRKGRRPSFSCAASPDEGERLYEVFLAQAQRLMPGRTANGKFGADMQVNLINDGPVTFLLDT